MTCIEALNAAKASPGKVGARYAEWDVESYLWFNPDEDDWDSQGNDGLWLRVWEVAAPEWETVAIPPGEKE